MKPFLCHGCGQNSAERISTRDKDFQLHWQNTRKVANDRRSDECHLPTVYSTANAEERSAIDLPQVGIFQAKSLPLPGRATCEPCFPHISTHLVPRHDLKLVSELLSGENLPKMKGHFGRETV